MVNQSRLYRTILVCTLSLLLAAPVSYGGGTPYDLELTIDATPDPAVAGGQLTVSLVATSNGPGSVPVPVIEFVTPAGTTFDSVETSGGVDQSPQQGGTGTVQCSLQAPLEPDDALTVQVVLNVTADPDDTLTLEATASANTPELDTDTSNNSASVEVLVTGSTVADLAVEVLAEDGAGSGAPYGFSVDLSNESEGEEPARGVQLIIHIPEGSTFNSVSDFDGNCSAPDIGESGAVVCSFDELFPGDVITIDVEVDIVAQAGVTLDFAASVTSESDDPEPSNNEDTVEVDVIPGPPAELDWDEPEEGGDLDFLPPRNLVADDDEAGAFGRRLARRATVIGYNIYGSSSPNVMPSPATFITSVGPTVTSASVTSAPAGTFFVVTAQYGGGESGPSNEASAQVPAATLTTVKVKGTKITANGTGFSATVAVFVDGIPFVAPAKVKRLTKVTQKGTLLTGQTIGAYLAQHPSVLITFRNENGGVVAYRHPQ